MSTGGEWIYEIRPGNGNGTGVWVYEIRPGDSAPQPPEFSAYGTARK